MTIVNYDTPPLLFHNFFVPLWKEISNISKVQFIPNLSKEILLFPSRIDEDIADDAPERIIDYVLDKIDISNILKLYHVKGRNAFYPRMMLKVIIYAYMNNIYSCRRYGPSLSDSC